MRRALIAVAVFALVTLGAPISSSEAAEPPPNDDFANAHVLTGEDLTYSQSTEGATFESGEPNHVGISGGASVWFSWTASSTRAVTIDLCGGDGTLDTLLAVYTGSSVDALSEVTSNDDECGVLSSVTFEAASGTTYKVAVDDWSGAGGPITLHLAVEPPTGVLSVAQRLDFGRVRDGLSKTLDLVLTNTGEAALVIDDIRLREYSFASGEFSIVSDNASGATINPGASRTVTIRFKPTHSDSGRVTGIEGSYWLDDFGRTLARYWYTGSGGTTVFHYVRNIGGRGNVSWVATAANKVGGTMTVSGQLTGTKTLLAGEYYAVAVASPSCGLTTEAYQTWGFGSLETKMTFKSLLPGSYTTCLDAPSDATFYRMGDAALVIETSAPFETEIPVPYVTDPDGSPWTATLLLGEGKAYCPGYAGDSRNQVVGTGAGDVLVGTAGPDIICGLGGRDVLRGNGGKDLLIGGAGVDKLFGGGGNDTLLTKDGTKDVLNGGAGRDVGKVDRYDVWKLVEIIRR